MFKALVLLFLLKIRFPRNTPISVTISRKFGQNVLSRFRNVENSSRKLMKTKLDYRYLESCKTFGIFPNFLKFKFYRRDLYNKEMYAEFQVKLLDLEMSEKKNQILKLSNKLKEDRMILRNSLSFINYLCLLQFINRNVKKIELQHKEIHAKKIEKLGGSLEFKKCNPDHVVFNFSDRILSSREKFLLSLGLDFKLPIFKPNFFKYYLLFEKFFWIIKKLKIADGVSFPEMCQEIKAKIFETFETRKYRKPFSPFIHKEDLSILKNLQEDTDLHITKPDKSKGVVLLNKIDYLGKMNEILIDRSKFLVESTDHFNLTLKIEDKVNRFIQKLKKLGIVTEEVYKKLYVTGSSPGILYGLVKTHKVDLPFRPILAAYNTAT